MNKQFQKIKIFMIFLMLFCSSLYFISPISKSAPLDAIYECKPVIIIEYDETLLQDPIIPYDEPRKIPIVVKAKIVGPAADIVIEKIGPGTKILLIVDMSIAEVSEGCHASINPPILGLDVSDEFLSANATISITIDQYLPAFSLKNVKIRMTTRRLGGSATLVKPGNFTYDIPFFVGYLPQLSFSYLKGNVKSISPDETAYFTIEIQNWGNADTKVNTELVDLPEDWKAEIVQNTTLGTILFGGTSKTISLNIKPPINFGYHEDRAIIKVRMTPVFYNDSDYSGEPHYLYFIVQSKGFATPGFEMITILLSFILVIFLIWKRKNNNKINEKQSGRRKK